MDKNIMIEEALKLLERYKSLEGFPEEMNGDNVGGVHFRSGYNYCLERCKLALLKKMDGIKDIVVEGICGQVTGIQIAQAIKDHLTK
jgi:hypothetical protein